MEENVVAYTVSEVTQIIKNELVFNPILNNVYIEGEISKVKISQGHAYFDLKDEESLISCTMWRFNVSKLDFDITKIDGAKVLICGSISVYEKRGSYNINVSKMALSGLGALYQKFEELKRTLTLEGYFDVEHKKRIPKMPKTVGVVTAINGAALQDVIRTLNHRYPLIKLLIYPCQVQGDRAKYDIASQIEAANNDNLCDTLIVCRGGGSLEDLWAFNERIVVEAIYNSMIPIICGVGHEVDHTLAEFAADVVAPTPTGAALLCVPDRLELLELLGQYQTSITDSIKKHLKSSKKDLISLHNRIEVLNPKSDLKIEFESLTDYESKLNYNLKNKLIFNSQRLEVITHKIESLSPNSLLENKKEKINNLKDNLDSLIKTNLNLKNHTYNNLESYFLNYNFNLEIYKENIKRHSDFLDNYIKNIIVNNYQRINHLDDILTSLSPLNVLSRGYTLTKSDDKVINSVKKVSENQLITTTFADGEVISIVKEIKDGR